MSAAFIIRFHYEPGDPRFEWRFAYFRDQVLPRILAQDPKIDVAIWCNPAHEDLFEKLDPRVRTFSVRGTAAHYRPGTRFFYDFAPWADVERLPRYELQFGLDSDDLIEPGYTDAVFAAIEANDARFPLHLCFQPRLLDVATGATKKMPQRYTPRRGSAFFALYQPADTWRYAYRFAYEESHLTIGTFFRKSVMVKPAGPPMCFASCHELNESTHL